MLLLWCAYWANVIRGFATNVMNLKFDVSAASISWYSTEKQDYSRGKVARAVLYNVQYINGEFKHVSSSFSVLLWVLLLCMMRPEGQGSHPCRYANRYIFLCKGALVWNLF